MSEIAIRAEGLGKRYRIGKRGPYRTLRETIARAVTAPFHARSGSNAPGAEDNAIWALKDFTFEIRRGEVVGVIGANGAGKSTLLKILSRITEPTTGFAEVRGRVRALLEVGTGFHPELTGRENIYLNGAIMGMKRVEIARKFDDIAAFAAVEKFLDTPVKHYSSGMYMRLAFSVAAHLEPEIFLVDEVLAVGDAEFQKRCIEKMEKVAGEGRTVVVVSHSMGTVKALCGRAILLERGTVKSAGPVDQVVADYLGSHQVDSAERVLSDSDHVEGVTRIRARSLRLLNGARNGFAVCWQQPISIAAEIEVYERVEDVIFGAGVKTVDGTLVFTVHSDIEDDKGRPGWTLDPGRYSLRFTLQNELRPALYKLGFGAASRPHVGRSNLLTIDGVMLEVLDFSERGSAPRPSCTGIVNGHSTWNLPVALP